MRALVVYESMFGNTKAVAESVAVGVSTQLPVELLEVGAAPPLAEVDADLLVLGGPTHAFGLSRTRTREDATARTGRSVISQRRGLREWLEDGGRAPAQTATFDTKVRRPNLPGSAARGAEKRLRRLGGRPVARAETFYVDGMEGPLLPGELDRAREWGVDLAQRAGDATPGLLKRP